MTHNNGFALGVESALQFLPMLLFGAWGGVIADRFDKRKLLYLTSIVAGVLAFGLGLIVAVGAATVLIDYVFSVLLGFVNVIDNPARQTFVMEMVGREELPNAVGLNSVVMNSSRVGRPRHRRRRHRHGRPRAVLLLQRRVLRRRDLRSVVDERQAAAAASPIVPRAKGQLREGFHYVWSERTLRTPLLMMAVIGTLAFNFQVVIPLIATNTFGLGAGGFGGLTAAMGAGAVLGGLAAASRRGVSYRRLIGLTYAMGVSILLAAAAPTLATEAIALFVMGATAFAFIATANTTLQLTARPEMRGRVMALYAIAFLGSTPVGSPIVGWISAVWGPRAGFAVGGVAALVAGFAAWLSFARMRAEREQRLDAVAAAAAA